MYRLYQKNQLTFSLVCIGAYVVLLPLCDNLSRLIGMQKAVTAPVCLLFALTLFLFLKRHDLTKAYGLCAFQGSLPSVLFFAPLMVIGLINLLNGVALPASVPETIAAVIAMLFIGWIEELLFRGLLFQAMRKDNIRMAMLVSSLTFGLGHIVNLLNGAAFVSTLLQIIYAAGIGFLFTVLVDRGKSLWPCIATHSLMNMLSVFHVQGSQVQSIILSALLLVVSVAYALWLLKHMHAASEQ